MKNRGPTRSAAARFAAALAMALVALIVLAAAPEPGHAQGADHDHHGHAHDHAGHAHDAAPAAPGDRALNKSTGAALVFWLFALGMLAGGVFVITRRNLITAVMGMVGTFFAIAVMYAMLYAHFLAAIQVLVYAGAIMVLFVFVIMILNKPEAEPWNATGLVGKILVMTLLGYFLLRLVLMLWSISPTPDMLAAPADVSIMTREGPQDMGFGSTKALGDTLFRDYLFPFEAVSLVLLIAVVGAVSVARPHERRPTADAGDVQGGEGAVKS